MPEQLHFIMEVAGCPTICMHCWAQGARYKTVPIEDIISSVTDISGFCEKAGLAFYPYPMHEVLAHPDAGQILSSFKPYVQFNPLATTGVPLAMRQDWKDLLKQIQSLGTVNTFVVHFHGIGETHDETMNRIGAYEETCLAVERIRSMGFGCIANVFVTKKNVHQTPQLIDKLTQLGISEMFLGNG